MDTNVVPTPATGDGAPAVVDPSAATPPVEVTPPVEGEKQPEQAAAPEIPEEALKVAAAKYAADKVKAANQTMAAARRAERAVETLKTENATVKQELGEYKSFVEQLGKDPDAAFKRLGYGSVKGYIDHVVKIGGGAQPAAETVEQRIERLEKERQEQTSSAARLAQETAVAESKRKVFDAVDKDKRFDLVTTDVGHGLLWDAIEAYHQQHGSCPDEAVYALAERVEKHLEANVSTTRKFSGQRPAETQNGAPPATQAATAGTNGGRTLTNSSTSSAPAARVYSLDPDERRKQVTEDMRAAGELT